MPGEQFNPFANMASSLRMVGEQANTAIKTLGDGVAQGASQMLTSAAQAAPPLPGIPGAQGNPGRGNPGNPGPKVALPQLIPTAALRAFSQVEEIVLPKGAPRPAATLLKTAGVQPPPAPARDPAPTPEAARPTVSVPKITNLGGY
ncbi:hypothetical protein LCGC14_1481910, partial [marine sediment metagenome]